MTNDATSRAYPADRLRAGRRDRAWVGTRRHLRRAGGALALLLPVLATAIGAPAAHASRVDKTFQYSCVLPIVGAQTIPITLRVTFPDTNTAGTAIASTTEVDVAVPDNVAAALPILGATKADLDSTLHTTWTGAVEAVVDGVLTVRDAAPPGGGAPWKISGTAAYPAVPTTAAGAFTVTVGLIDLVLTLRKADGSVTRLGVVNQKCTLIAGQDPTLVTGTIGAAPAPGPGPGVTAAPTTPPTNAPTAAPVTPAPTATTKPTVAGAAVTTTVASAAPTTTISDTDATVADYGGLLDQYFTMKTTAVLNRVSSETAIAGGRFVTLLNLQNGLFFGEFTLPPNDVHFKLFGLMPVTASVQFEQIDPAFGKIDNGVVTAMAKVRLTVSSIRLGRLTLPAGANCATTTPIELPLASGPNFNPLEGGTVSGAFVIPAFGDCALVGGLANQAISGPGNRLVLDLKPTTK